MNDFKEKLFITPFANLHFPNHGRIFCDLFFLTNKKQAIEFSLSAKYERNERNKQTEIKIKKQTNKHKQAK